MSTIHPGRQPMQALQHANETRYARAELRHAIADGRITVASVLLNPPENTGSWAIFDVLRAQPRWGRVRTVKFLAAQHISERRPVRALTERQRVCLARLLGEPTPTGEGETC